METTLQVERKNAHSAYNKADAAGKKLLSDLFPNQFGKITDRVQTFEDILAISGKTMADLQQPGDTDDEVAYKQIKLIRDVYNEGDNPDPFNPKQGKYYPWHEVVKDSTRPSGFGLSYYRYDYWTTHSYVGVRLCFKSAELAIDAGKKFIEIYERLKIR